MEPVWFSYDVTTERLVNYPDEPVWRPFLDVKMVGRTRKMVASAKLLVDSGSELTLVKYQFARRLGIEDELKRGKPEHIRIGGKPRVAELATVQLVIKPFGSYESVVGFIKGWEEWVHAGVIGHRGLFDHFGVIFDRDNLRFALLPTKELGSRYPPRS